MKMITMLVMIIMLLMIDVIDDEKLSVAEIMVWIMVTAMYNNVDTIMVHIE